MMHKGVIEMNLLSNEIEALKVVLNEDKPTWNAKTYLAISTKLKKILNADFVTFSNRKNIIFIEYCEKGQNKTVKIQSKKSLLKGV